MSYDFEELDGDLSCAEVARKWRSLLLGRVAVCTSFDSGLIVDPTWLQVNGHCITPTIDDRLLETWPVSHDEFCDEWWVFDIPVPSDFQVTAFCNFVGERIADYKKLDWEGGCPLDSYLLRFRPAVVFGNNEYTYMVRRIDAG